MTTRHQLNIKYGHGPRKYILLTLILVTLAGCEKEESKIDNFQLARFYFESGNDVMSLQFLQKELESGGEGQQVHQLAAEIYYELEYFPQAVSHLKSAITLGCEQPCVSSLISAYLGQHKVDLAEQELDNLIDKDTTTAKYQSALIDHSRHGDFSETIKQLEAIDLPAAKEKILLLKLEQGLFADVIAGYDDRVEYSNTELLTFAKAFYATKQIEKADKMLLSLRLKQKGELLTNQKIQTVELLVKVNVAKNQFDAADQIYQAFLKKHEGTSYVSYRKSLNYLSKLDFKSAVEEVDELAQVYPENVQIAAMLAVAQFGKGDYQAVVSVLENLKGEANEQLLVLLSSSYNQLYRAGDTISLLENIERSNKLTAILSRAYLIQGNKKQALELIKSLDIDAENPGDASYLAKLMYELRLFEQIVSRYSGDTDYSAAIKYLVVNSYLNLKQEAKARAYIEKQVDGNLPVEMMGYLETQIGQFDEAIKNYKALVQASPVKKSYFLLARAYLVNNAYDLALSTIKTGAQLSGQNQALLILANRILHEKNDLETKLWLESIQETHHDYKQAQVFLADYEIKEGEDSKAVQRLSSLTGTDDQQVYFLLAKANRRLNPAKSLEMLEKSFEIEYSLNVASLLHRYYNKTSDLANLERVNNLIANRSGVNINTVSQLFRGYLKLDQPDKAKELAETLIFQGHNRLGGELVGDLLAIKGDFTAAANQYSGLIESETDDRLWVKFYKARFRQDPANTGEILEEIENRLRQYPEMNALRNLLAINYIGLNNDRAIMHFEVLLSRYPDDSVLLNNLAWVNLDTNPEKALKYSEMAYQKNGNSSGIIDTHVRALKRNNQYDKAAAILKEKIELSPDNETLNELMKELQLQD